MATNRIADMTIDELTRLIDRRIKRVIAQHDDQRTLAEINASIRRNRIVPPPGSKSALEMLREDRDA